MNAQVRRKLEMAARVREFCRTHPLDNARYISALGRLEQLLAEAEQLFTRAGVGETNVRAATVNRKKLRGAITTSPLRHLARIARAAAVEEPGLARMFKAPSLKLGHLAFLNAVRTMAAQAEQRQELFVSYGLPAGFLDQLRTTLAEFEASLGLSGSGVGAHVGARVQLRTLTREIMALVKQLDAMNRYRFEEGSEELAAWDSVRDLPWPGTRPDDPPAGGSGTEGVA